MPGAAECQAEIQRTSSYSSWRNHGTDPEVIQRCWTRFREQRKRADADQSLSSAAEQRSGTKGGPALFWVFSSTISEHHQHRQGDRPVFHVAAPAMGASGPGDKHNDEAYGEHADKTKEEDADALSVVRLPPHKDDFPDDKKGCH